jgi:hypothetical protein
MRKPRVHYAFAVVGLALLSVATGVAGCDDHVVMYPGIPNGCPNGAGGGAPCQPPTGAVTGGNTCQQPGGNCELPTDCCSGLCTGGLCQPCDGTVACDTVSQWLTQSGQDVVPGCATPAFLNAYGANGGHLRLVGNACVCTAVAQVDFCVQCGIGAAPKSLNCGFCNNIPCAGLCPPNSLCSGTPSNMTCTGDPACTTPGVPPACWMPSEDGTCE